MRRFGNLAGLLVWLTAAALTAAQNIETRDGVRLVHNRGRGTWGKRPALALEKVRTLGDIEAADENVAFYMPLDMALGADGVLYVLDTGNHRIQKFSPEGEFLTSIGREGQGPGEFNYPGSLALDGDQGLIVTSPFIQRIQFLDAAGKETGSLTLTERLTAYLAWQPGGRLLSAVRKGMPIPGNDDHKNGLDPLLQVMDMEGKVLRTFGDPQDFKHGLVNARANEIAFAIGPDRHVYVTFLHLNRIEKYSPEGDLLWRADRELSYKSDKPLDKGKIETPGRGNISIHGARMNRCSEAVAADESGRVWVITLDRQLEEEEQASTSIRISQGSSGSSITMAPRGGDEVTGTDAYRLEVFDAEGILLGRIPLDHFADRLLIRGDRLLILDKLRRMQVHEYRIVDSGGR